MSSLVHSKNKGKGRQKSGIDYMNDEFDWMAGLKGRMKAVFGIDNFRLCQQGVCNANMDARDIVCVMPTGGGKSLTYQLPALLTPGCTLVISPLISLMTDQILHLQEAGVEAVKLTGSTSLAEKKEVQARLKLQAERRLGPEDREIKLCYVTPEKLAKDNSFLSLLQKLDSAGKFARIVIDEAHCVSHLGHDFRPDYQKLHRLRQLFPNVPVMALSATCPPAVLQDIIKTLGLRAVVDGNNAAAEGTVYFSSPLYRKNLHYKVLPKPAKAEDTYKTMAKYILEHHPNDSGIVYCFTKKDTETVAEKLRECSQNQIRTGVYHAGVADGSKENLHKAWRQGTVKVVCATIAFGMGIDKGDVRFVLHHSKSLEGYYQESGRAGRDGRPADCILYYRPQDLSTIGAITASEKDGQSKLHAMLEFAEDLKECRKIQFAKYFSHSTETSISSWATEDEGALDNCAHCDNCTRSPESFDCKDVTLAAWQILKITAEVQRTRGKLTLSMLASLAKSAKGGTYDVGKGKKKEKADLDLNVVCGGPVELSKDDIEHLLVRLLIKQYLQEEYQQTAYQGILYLVPGPFSPQLIHKSRESLLDGRRKLEFLFNRPFRKAKANSKTEKAGSSKDPNQATIPAKRKAPPRTKRSKANDLLFEDEEDEEGILIVPDSDDESGSWLTNRSEPSRRAGKSNSHRIPVEEMNDDDSDEVSYEWSHNLRDDPPAKRRRSDRNKGIPRTNIFHEGDNEVLVLSSD
ncbi:P-loop containing nucleoside triphosphate hydrolase protein [Crucibulum laeve]|uniref:ATP-dependent DNA helicase n=1 Tax=Crucibulum laeve TaxID=68775 RepID=A0A5C3M1Q7_9AGAR|nr:P-loop containing nucleoside triphosphate hydrolase protein [Crucibulum laeve]